MGKGLAKRRRERNAKEANVANLHKAQVRSCMWRGLWCFRCSSACPLPAQSGAGWERSRWRLESDHLRSLQRVWSLMRVCYGRATQLGKARSSMPLPQPPTGADFQDRMTSSLRRMLEAKKALEAVEQRRKEQRAMKRPAALSASGAAGVSPAVVEGGSSAPLAAPDRQPSQQGAQTGSGTQATTSRQASAPRQQQQHGNATKPGGSGSSGNAAPASTSGRMLGMTAFEAQQAAAAAARGLKARKKEYLKNKKLKKKAKQVAAAQRSVEAARLTDKPAFGEQVAAPPKVHLKSKHWSEAENTAAARCKDVFLKQMGDAVQRMGGAAGTSGRSGAADSSGGATRHQRSGGNGGWVTADLAGTQPKQLGKKRPLLDADEADRLRSEAIAAYRAQRHGSGSGGGKSSGATMESLARLARVGAAAQAVSA